MWHRLRSKTGCTVLLVQRKLSVIGTDNLQPNTRMGEWKGSKDHKSGSFYSQAPKLVHLTHRWPCFHCKIAVKQADLQLFSHCWTCLVSHSSCCKGVGTVGTQGDEAILPQVFSPMVLHTYTQVVTYGSNAACVCVHIDCV